MQKVALASRHTRTTLGSASPRWAALAPVGRRTWRRPRLRASFMRPTILEPVILEARNPRLEGTDRATQ